MLAEFARTRSEAAFAVLVERYGGLVYGVALRRVRDAAAAEDVAQQVFTTVCQRPTAVRGGAVAGWLHTAARHHAADWLRADRRRRRRERRAARPERVDAPPVDEADDLARRIDSALSGLSRGDRDLVLSHYVGGQPYPALAGQRGISEATARKRVSRAVERLRRSLAGRGTDPGPAGVAAGLAALPFVVPAEVGRRLKATAGGAAAGGGRWRRFAALAGAAVPVVALVVVLVLFLRPPATHQPRPATVTPAAPPEPPRAAVHVLAAAALVAASPDRKYTTSMATGADGDLWLGTEAAGVWRFDPDADAWHRFTSADGLGDDSVYAVAVDHRGRVWVGHGRRGVSVFDGRHWQNYDTVGGPARGDVGDRRPDALSGPIGGRVFALAVSPTTGDVWMATDAGLTRYADAAGTWTPVTRADGLPSDLASAIAFDSAGNVYVGLQTDGVAMADAADGFAHWRQVTAPFRPDPATAAATGTGLPSGYVDDVLVAADGRVYAATPEGLAWSDDHGRGWRYVRGADWSEKAQMDALPAAPRWDGRAAELPTPTPPRPARGGAVLAEDYVQTLGQTPAGELLVGYRRRGCEAFTRTADGSLIRGRAVSPPPTPRGRDNCVRAVPRGADGYPCVGLYLSDRVQIVRSADGSEPEVTVESPPPGSAAPPLPAAAAPPDLAALAAELRQAAAVPPQSPEAGTVLPLDDDWRTQGEWTGRYGRYWCLLSAIDSDANSYVDYVWGAAPVPVGWSVGIGHNAPPTEYTRYDAKPVGDDAAAPELPPVLRDARVRNGLIKPGDRTRFATRNDGSLHYPQTYDGPNLVYRLGVPAGTFVLSAYEVNGDERANLPNDRRDYGVVVRSADGTAPTAALPERGTGGTDLDRGPVLAQGRVRDFINGVYKRFLVQGPASLAVTIARDYSYVTTSTGLMLDRADPYPRPYFKPPATRPAESGVSTATAAGAAAALAAELDRQRQANPAWWAVHHRADDVSLARWYAAHPEVGDPAGRALALYGSDLFAAAEAVDRAAGRRPARDVERSLRWDGHTADNSGTEARVIDEARSQGAFAPATRP